MYNFNNNYVRQVSDPESKVAYKSVLIKYNGKMWDYLITVIRNSWSFNNFPWIHDELPVIREYSINVKKRATFNK